MFYTELEVVPDFDLRLFRRFMYQGEWEVVEGRDYQTLDVSTEFLDYRRAFFLRLPPKGKLHKHVDCGDCETDHIVIETNPKAVNWWHEDGEDRSAHFELGHRYKVNRTLLHWAVNDGDEPRTHLLLEY